MVKVLVSLLLSFPRICEYFFKIVEAYEKEAYRRNRERNIDLIDDWLQDDTASSEQDSPFYLETQSPFIHRTSKGDYRRDSKIHE
tara:strand:- start:228 stop:482 length:255 start_codon:yes stop_codon:yes gene_type:complete